MPSCSSRAVRSPASRATTARCSPVWLSVHTSVLSPPLNICTGPDRAGEGLGQAQVPGRGRDMG